MSQENSVSVLVATRNRPELLARCIESVLVQDMPLREILVYDDASDPPIESSHLPDSSAVPLRVLRSDSPSGVVVARNTLMREAQGTILLLIDDDARLVGMDTDRALRDAFADPQIGIVAGRLYEDHEGHRKDLVPFAKKDRFEGRLDHQGLCSYYLGGLHAVRADILPLTGGYEPALVFGEEELDLSYRTVAAGYHILYTPRLLAHHTPPQPQATPSQRPRIYYNIRNRIYLAARYLPRRYWPTYLTIWTLVIGMRAIRAGEVRPFIGGVREGIRFARASPRDRLPPTALGYLRRHHGRLWY